MTRLQVIAALGVGSFVGLGLAVGANAVLPESPVVRGLSIGGQRVPARGSAVTWLGERERELQARPVRFHAEDRVFDATLGDAGISIDFGATLASASAVGHEGSFLDRVRATRKARRGETDVPIVYRSDPAKVKALFAKYALEIAREPVDASIDLDRHEKIADVPGRALDVDASARIFGAASHAAGETIELLVKAVDAKVTADDLGRVDVTKVFSSHETHFSLYGTGAGRAANIRLAASLLDGAVLAPGQVLSFNDRVGARTKDRGFALAPEIQGDEMQLGFGGGTCQVSSTLHIASLYGAIEVVERQSHSRPSAYAMLGLDATVSFPTTDLKIRNNLSFPILIHAFLPQPTSVKIEILGGDPIAKVVYGYGVNGTEDFARRVEVKRYLEPGKTVRHQKGSRGYDITSVVHIHYLDGRDEDRHYYSGYRPAPEILYVGPGTRDDQLPPMPEHASGIVTDKKRVSRTEGREGEPVTPTL